MTVTRGVERRAPKFSGRHLCVSSLGRRRVHEAAVDPALRLGRNLATGEAERPRQVHGRRRVGGGTRKLKL